MIFSRFFGGRWRPYRVAGLALMLALTSCSSLVGSRPTPTPTPIMLTLVPLPTPGTAYTDLAGARPFIDTFNNIHLFESFDYNIPDPAAVAKYYDFVWGAAVDHVQAIRAGNPKIFIAYYIPFHRDSGTFARPDAIHDLSYWQANHPDWVLYKCDRVTPAYEFGDPNIPLDFSNPALISWQIQMYAQMASQSGYDGIAADNLSLQNYYGACGVYVNGKWKQLYSGQPDDPQWRENVLVWTARIQQALHSLSHPLALIPNFSLGNIPPSDPIVQQIIHHVDGVLDEDGFTDDARGDLSGNKWVQLVQLMESVQQQHKPFYLVNQFNSAAVDSNEIQWALASYLMGKEHSAALFISTYQAYGRDTRYYEYAAQVGSPSGPMYKAQNVYWRNYSRGISIANPNATQSYTVSLNSAHSYVSLYGFAVGPQVTLPPRTGMVLLFSR